MTQKMLGKCSDDWQNFLNIMQRINLEVQNLQQNGVVPKAIYLGRKELYELHRDWENFLEQTLEGEKILGIPILKVATTEHFHII